jgi:signal transduction histidine kinase
MNVKHILSIKGHEVFTIESTATLADVVKVLAQRQIGALVVTGADGSLTGIISERDIVRALDQYGTGILTSPVIETMTGKVVTCTDTVSDVEIMTRMTQGNFRHVPVVERGRLSGIISIGDVVKLRLEELENKLMNIETITAAIAHEVRQPLAAIAANSGAALRFLERCPPVDLNEVRGALNRIIRDCHRTSEVFDSIRALFRAADQGRQPIDVNGIISEVLRTLSPELNDYNVTVQSDLMSDLPFVEGHGGQLQQVIHNLVRNAVEAMETTKGRGRVLRVATNLCSNGAIRVTLEDSGPGIDAERLAHIFDAFVTTKAHGMGLGLAICRTIIERHGGQLTASSDGKSGAEFQFVLPTVTTVTSPDAPIEPL